MPSLLPLAEVAQELVKVVSLCPLEHEEEDYRQSGLPIRQVPLLANGVSQFVLDEVQQPYSDAVVPHTLLESFSETS